MILFKKLDSQLFFITTAPLIFIIGAISLFFLSDSIDDANRDIETKGQYLSEQASLLAEFSLYTGNIEEIQSIADLMLQSEGVDFIKFSDSFEKTLVFVEKKEYQNSKEFKTPVYSTNTILDDFETSDSQAAQQILGYISLGLSNREITSKKQSIYKRILAVALLAIMGGLLITYFFSRKILVGLNSLKKTALQIEQKKLDERCLENGVGELLTIQKVFNNMAESIQLNEQFLQEKINDATYSLNQTIDELSKKNIELDKTRKIAIDLERSKAISEERARIMKDMHDGIGGQLVASLALLEKENNSPIKDNIAEILSNCLDDFRLIINSINPGANILLSLLADFKYRMNKRLDNINIRLDWQVNEIADKVYLHPQQSLHILRVLQESFSNILKHANADVIYFSVKESSSSVILSIEDNGEFTNTEGSPCGQGVRNMNWRAQQLNGDFSISKSDQGGCRIELTIPKAKLTIKLEDHSEFH